MVVHPFTSSLVFANRGWLWIAVIFFAVAVLIVCRQYRFSQALQPWRTASLMLKTVGFFLLALSLLEPQWISEEPETGANLVAVLADNSRGMKVREQGADETRAERVLAAFADEADESHWIRQLEKDFPVRRYAFDSQLRRIRNFSGLQFDGSSSQLHSVLASLARRFDGRPLAAVLLFTDGAATDAIAATISSGWKNLPPVYPVIVARKAPERDLAIETTNVSETAYEDAPVTILATVRALGFAGNTIALKLLDQKGVELDRQIHQVSEAQETHTFRFLQKPKTPGITFYRVQVVAVGNEDSAQAEATPENNSRLVSVNRDRGPHRILYVSGRPNWEFKFLKRALKPDPEVELAGLIRIAKREPKFTWRGRQGESTNPLFRGFNRDDDDESQYDSPVLIRIDTRDDKELLNGFPKTKDELFPYSAVVVDDLESAFFTFEQMELIEDYVSNRGGSFLMLGGQESFDHGKYQNTPLSNLLPIHLRRPYTQPPGSEMKVKFTREGWLEPWFRLRQTEDEEARRLKDMPAFKSLNKSSAVKPGATILADVRIDERDWPAVVAQRYGDGKVASILLADLWRWGFKNDKAQPDMEKLWRQLVRWLISDVPSAVDIRRTAASENSTAVQFEVFARDDGFKAVPNAAITIKVTDDAGKATELFTTPDDEYPGRHTASFAAKEGGAFSVEAEVRGADGLLVGRSETGWAQNMAAEEFKRMEPNTGLLEAIARETGGRILEPEELEDFVESLPETKLPVMKTVSTPIWHTPVFFLIALGCFLADWAMRRVKGLA